MTGQSQLMVLAPPYYEGDVDSCVVGRLVLLRGPFQIERKKTAGGRGKGKGAQCTATLKTEAHFLGGPTVSDLLYVEAWGEAATDFAKAVRIGGVYCISGGDVVSAAPQYSTSRLHYYMKVKAPLGIATRVTETSDKPWTDLPTTHPFTSVESLGRVPDNHQVCLVAVVAEQPGVKQRDTRFGPSQVCNAVLRQGTTSIRCSFWKAHAEALAEWALGETIALMQVRVQKDENSYSVTATEATTIMRCPESVKEEVTSATDLAQDAQCLTQHAQTDYDTVRCKPATLSILAGLIVHDTPRTLAGVYEVHSVAVCGIAPMASSETWLMTSCSVCKRQLQSGQTACAEHGDAAAEKRWLLSVDFADCSGHLQRAMLYHDVAMTIPCLQEAFVAGEPDSRTKAMLVRQLRRSLWSIRAVYKLLEYKNESVVEIKRMALTVTSGGVLASWQLVREPPRTGEASGACPITRCGDLGVDESFGLATDKDVPVAAARVLVIMEAIGEDEETARPDPSNKGFQVQRRVRCALSPECEDATSPAEKYYLQSAGLSGAVQWLMTAAADTMHFLTVKPFAGRLHSEGDTSATRIMFSVQSHEEAKGCHGEQLRKLLQAHLERQRGPAIKFSAQSTPLKRLALFDELSNEGAGSTEPFSKRRSM